MSESGGINSFVALAFPALFIALPLSPRGDSVRPPLSVSLPISFAFELSYRTIERDQPVFVDGKPDETDQARIGFVNSARLVPNPRLSLARQNLRLHSPTILLNSFH